MTKLSLVIPVYNEAENIKPLYREIISILRPLAVDFEIIFVNDGSRDATQTEIESLFKEDPRRVRGIKFRNNFGKAAALHAGFKLAAGDFIATLDGDLQDDPRELPKFLEKINEGYDLVSGWKMHRKDSFIKNNTSKIFNFATNLISKTKLHDFNCGFKMYRANAAKGLNLYGELHRYIPVIIASQGFLVTEMPVEHRQRQFGKTKYGSIRFIHGLFDLLTVLFITRFRSRPLHLFGYLGLGFLGVGFVIGLYLAAIQFFEHQVIGNRPLLLLAIMLMIMGVQISAIGLVGEQITTVIHKNEPDYTIEKILKEEK